MKNNKWSKIKQYDYYKTIDSLERKELKEGDMIEILFPDAEEHPYITKPVTFSVCVKTGMMETKVDMSGGPDTHRYSKAFVNIDYNGLSVPIYLRNYKELKIRRAK